MRSFSYAEDFPKLLEHRLIRTCYGKRVVNHTVWHKSVCDRSQRRCAQPKLYVSLVAPSHCYKFDRFATYTQGKSGVWLGAYLVRAGSNTLAIQSFSLADSSMELQRLTVFSNSDFVRT